jgi:hypothetical protein
MKYVIMLAVIFAMTLAVVVVYRIGLSAGRRGRRADNVERHDTAHLKASLHQDNRIRELQANIDSLNELNGRYLKFILNISTIVQRLNSTMLGTISLNPRCEGAGTTIRRYLMRRAKGW